MMGGNTSITKLESVSLDHFGLRGPLSGPFFKSDMILFFKMLWTEKALDV